MGESPPEDADAQRVIGRRVRTARKEKGLTQEGLGHEVFLHRTFIGRLERGETNPTAWTLIRVAAGLGIDPGTFLAGLHPGPD